MTKIATLLLLCSLPSLSAMNYRDSYSGYGSNPCPPAHITIHSWPTHASFASGPQDNRSFDGQGIRGSLFGNPRPLQPYYAPIYLDLQLKSAIETKQPAEYLINLIRQGANPTTALQAAIQVTYPENSVLYAQNSDSYDRHAHALKILLMYGAKPTAALVTTAKQRHCYRSFSWLIQYGADPDTVVDLSNTTALMALATAPNADITEGEIVQGMQTIVCHGAQVNKQDMLGRTALMLFLLCKPYDKQASVARTLLALGTNPHIHTNAGRSALDYACNQEHKTLILESIALYHCLICVKHQSKDLKPLPCANKHWGNFICPECLWTVKTQDNSCPLCSNQLS
jgi:hypothetical protein